MFTHLRPVYAAAAALCTAALCTAALADPAAAAAPVDLDGTYDVACREARIVFGLQDFEFVAEDGAVRLSTPESHRLTFDGLSCAPEDAPWMRLLTEWSCQRQVDHLVGLEGLRDDLCRAVGEAAAGALTHLGERLSGELEVAVQPRGFFGLYAMDGILTDRTGEVDDRRYAITADGRFAALALRPVALAAPPLCGLTLGLSSFAVDGRIDRDAGHALRARSVHDVSLLCDLPGADDADRVGRLGVTVQAEIEGTRR